ncbi:MAG: peptidoglycan-binding domain-containing protein [Candidatus Paceibacterota bacterium]
MQSFLKLLPSVYPEKLITGYFGAKTENAVKRLQSLLKIETTGQTDANTQESFCNLFANLKSSDVPTIISSSASTTSIFQTLCLAMPSQTTIGKDVLFISQILGGTSPYKYI